MGSLYGFKALHLIHVIISQYILLIILHIFEKILVGKPRMDDIL